MSAYLYMCVFMDICNYTLNTDTHSEGNIINTNGSWLFIQGTENL
jgi:hypothetical protein